MGTLGRHLRPGLYIPASGVTGLNMLILECSTQNGIVAFKWQRIGDRWKNAVDTIAETTVRQDDTIAWVIKPHIIEEIPL